MVWYVFVVAVTTHYMHKIHLRNAIRAWDLPSTVATTPPFPIQWCEAARGNRPHSKPFMFDELCHRSAACPTSKFGIAVKANCALTQTKRPWVSAPRRRSNAGYHRKFSVNNRPNRCLQIHPNVLAQLTQHIDFVVTSTTRVAGALSTNCLKCKASGN